MTAGSTRKSASAACLPEHSQGRGHALRACAMPSDTIFALSSGSPPAAIAVIRVSGPGALAAGAALAGRLPPARQVRLRELRDAGGMLLDHALVLPFDGTASS